VLLVVTFPGPTTGGLTATWPGPQAQRMSKFHNTLVIKSSSLKGHILEIYAGLQAEGIVSRNVRILTYITIVLRVFFLHQRTQVNTLSTS
jgi:hypothetical protein